MVLLRKSLGSVNLTLPEDPEILKSAGAVALAHGHLELILRMTIKTLANLTVHEALDSTERESNSNLRKDIQKLFNQKTTTASLRQKLKALLGKCERLSIKRNQLIHNAWAIGEDGSVLTKGPDHAWGAAITSDELLDLASEIGNVAEELNAARLKGFINEVCQSEKSEK